MCDGRLPGRHQTVERRTDFGERAFAFQCVALHVRERVASRVRQQTIGAASEMRQVKSRRGDAPRLKPQLLGGQVRDRPGDVFSGHHERVKLARSQSRAVLAVREEVRARAGAQVGTVGYVRVDPGAVNIVPGRVEFPVELRDLDASKVREMWARIEKRFAEMAQEERVTLECSPSQSTEPALTDVNIQTEIRAAARGAGLTTLDLPSGAGHDTQQIAHIAPMGMIFVPSRDGISHSPREYSSPDAVANGAEVLYRTVLLSDERLDRTQP
jgi:hypothetical protein